MKITLILLILAFFIPKSALASAAEGRARCLVCALDYNSRVFTDIANPMGWCSGVRYTFEGDCRCAALRAKRIWFPDMDVSDWCRTANSAPEVLCRDGALIYKGMHRPKLDFSVANYCSDVDPILEREAKCRNWYLVDAAYGHNSKTLAQIRSTCD